MSKETLPKEYVNVMITYKGKVKVRDKYYDHYEDQIVTRRAFYTKSDGFYDRKDNWIETPKGYFHVPQYWQEWKGALLPHTLYHLGRVYPKDIINWEYDNLNQNKDE
tara:strand:- start:2172 stop:2492 length:321 start_codon:yes stop_codon:yes gene_type:complete